MASILKATQAPVSGDALGTYEFAIDQQALAFRLSALTRDFTSFHVLRALDTTSSSNPGTDLISLCPDRGPTLIDDLISTSNNTIQAIHDSFQTYANRLRPRPPPGGEDPPPPGGPPSPLPQVVYGLIQQHINEVIVSVDKGASEAKDLINGLPNSPAQEAAVEVWALGLRAIVPAAQLSIQLAYAIFDPIPGLPSPKIGHGTVNNILAISGGPVLVPESWLGDILGALGTALIAVGNALADIGRVLKKIQ